jgi:hypothetical protein
MAGWYASLFRLFWLRSIGTFGLLLVCYAAPVSAQEKTRADAPAIKQETGPWVMHRHTIPQASRVDLSHLGVHTHANVITFDTGALNVTAMQADRSQARYRSVTLVGKCRLDTDHAALPPAFKDFASDIGKVPNPYGPIDGRLHGKPGWVTAAYREGAHNRVRISVPTRFANWVAGQKPQRRRQYQDRRSYTLQITWQERE